VENFLFSSSFKKVFQVTVEKVLFDFSLFDLSRISILSFRFPVNFFRPLHSQSLVGALAVKFLSPQIKRRLVTGQIPMYLTLQFHTDVSVKPFVTPVLLRMSWTNPVQFNPQRYPPDRKSGKSQGGNPVPQTRQKTPRGVQGTGSSRCPRSEHDPQ